MNTTMLADLWATRPVRRRPAKWAGVCAGFGARYNVDPTLVRVAFVIATIFGGAGVLLYLAAIVALPHEHRAAHEEHDHSKHTLGLPKGRFIILVIIAIVLVGSFGGRTWSGGGLVGAALLLLGWWLLYQRTPVAPAGTSAATFDPSGTPVGSVENSAPAAPFGPAEGAAPAVPAEQPASASPGQPVERAATGEPGDSSPADTPLLIDSPPTPPAWDPLGVAPFAWDLPEPPAQAPPPAPLTPRSPVTPVTTGLAVLVGVAGAALHWTGVDWFTTGRIASLILLVFGAGMVVAGLQRRPEGTHASGLVPLGMLTAAVVVVSSLVTSTGWSAPSGGIGERKWAPTEQSQLRDDYQLTVGNTILDLRGLEALDHDQTVNIKQGVGQVEVLLPEKVRVRAECSVGIGDFACPQGIVGGNDDGPVLTINARTGMGNVEMNK